MIDNFRGRFAKTLFEGRSPRGFPPQSVKVARRKLEMIEAAADLRDLRSPPGNQLEPLKGNRRGQHSIRINDQWRVCFRWKNDRAYDVEVVDYH